MCFHRELLWHVWVFNSRTMPDMVNAGLSIVGVDVPVSEFFFYKGRLVKWMLSASTRMPFWGQVPMGVFDVPPLC